jgi:hypothetical protein
MQLEINIYLTRFLKHISGKLDIFFAIFDTIEQGAI